MMYREERAMILAAVTELHDEQIVYPSCTSCHTKLYIDPHTQWYECLRCGLQGDGRDIQWRYRLVMSISDGNILGKVVVFGHCLDTFFGKTATQFYKSITGLEKSRYPASSLLKEALARSFLGKYFFFGFKLSRSNGVPSLSDVLSTAAGSTNVCSQYSELSQRSNIDNSHSLAYQMLSGSDGVFATVTDHMRALVKQLLNSDNSQTNPDPKSCSKADPGANRILTQHGCYTGGKSNSSHYSSLSESLKPEPLVFSFEAKDNISQSETLHQPITNPTDEISKVRSGSEDKNELEKFNYVHSLALDQEDKFLDSVHAVTFESISQSFLELHNMLKRSLPDSQCTVTSQDNVTYPLSDFPITQKLNFNTSHFKLSQSLKFDSLNFDSQCDPQGKMLSTSSRIDQELEKREKMKSSQRFSIKFRHDSTAQGSQNLHNPNQAQQMDIEAEHFTKTCAITLDTETDQYDGRHFTKTCPNALETEIDKYDHNSKGSASVSDTTINTSRHSRTSKSLVNCKSKHDKNGVGSAKFPDARKEADDLYLPESEDLNAFFDSDTSWNEGFPELLDNVKVSNQSQISQDLCQVKQAQTLISQDQCHVNQDQFHISQDKYQISQDQCRVSQCHVSQGQCHVSQDQCQISQDQCHISQDQCHVNQCHVSQHRCHIIPDKCRTELSQFTSSNHLNFMKYDSGLNQLLDKKFTNYSHDLEVCERDVEVEELPESEDLDAFLFSDFSLIFVEDIDAGVEENENSEVGDGVKKQNDRKGEPTKVNDCDRKRIEQKEWSEVQDDDEKQNADGKGEPNKVNDRLDCDRGGTSLLCKGSNSGDILCKGSVGDDVLCKGSVGDDISCNGRIGDDILFKGSVGDDILCKKSIGDILCKESIGDDFLCKECIDGDIVCKVSIDGDILCKGSIGDDTLCKECIDGDILCKGSIGGDILSKGSIADGVTSETFFDTQALDSFFNNITDEVEGVKVDYNKAPDRITGHSSTKLKRDSDVLSTREEDKVLVENESIGKIDWSEDVTIFCPDFKDRDKYKKGEFDTKYKTQDLVKPKTECSTKALFGERNSRHESDSMYSTFDGSSFDSEMDDLMTHDPKPSIPVVDRKVRKVVQCHICQSLNFQREIEPCTTDSHVLQSLLEPEMTESMNHVSMPSQVLRCSMDQQVEQMSEFWNTSVGDLEKDKSEIEEALIGNLEKDKSQVEDVFIGNLEKDKSEIEDVFIGNLEKDKSEIDVFIGNLEKDKSKVEDVLIRNSEDELIGNSEKDKSKVDSEKNYASPPSKTKQKLRPLVLNTPNIEHLNSHNGLTPLDVFTQVDNSCDFDTPGSGEINLDVCVILDSQEFTPFEITQKTEKGKSTEADVKRVQFDKRLQSVRSCELMDVKMKLKKHSPITSLRVMSPGKSCIRTGSRLSNLEWIHSVALKANDSSTKTCAHKSNTSYEQGSKDTSDSESLTENTNSPDIVTNTDINSGRTLDTDVENSFNCSQDLFSTSADLFLSTEMDNRTEIQHHTSLKVLGNDLHSPENDSTVDLFSTFFKSPHVCYNTSPSVHRDNRVIEDCDICDIHLSHKPGNIRESCPNTEVNFKLRNFETPENRNPKILSTSVTNIPRCITHSKQCGITSDIDRTTPCITHSKQCGITSDINRMQTSVVKSTGTILTRRNNIFTTPDIFLDSFYDHSCTDSLRQTPQLSKNKATRQILNPLVLNTPDSVRQHLSKGRATRQILKPLVLNTPDLLVNSLSNNPKPDSLVFIINRHKNRGDENQQHIPRSIASRSTVSARKNGCEDKAGDIGYTGTVNDEREDKDDGLVEQLNDSVLPLDMSADLFDDSFDSWSASAIPLYDNYKSLPQSSHAPNKLCKKLFF